MTRDPIRDAFDLVQPDVERPSTEFANELFDHLLQQTKTPGGTQARRRRRIPTPPLPVRKTLIIAAALAIVAAVLIPLLPLIDNGVPGATPTATSTGPVTPVRLEPAETIHVDYPQGLAIEGGSIWTASEFLDAVDRIDLNTHQVDTIPLGAGFSPQGVLAAAGAVWVPGEGGIARVDPATGKFTVPIHGLVKWLASGFGSLWASGSTGVIQVDPETSTIVRKIRPPCAVSVPGGLAWAVVSVGAGSVWVSCGQRVERIDPSTGQVIAIVAHPGRVFAGTVTQVLAAGDSVWLMSWLDPYAVKHPADAFSTLDRIDPSTNELVPGSTIHIAKGASLGSPVPVGDQIWFPTTFGVGPDVGMLFVFNATTGRVVETFDLSEGKGYGDNAIAFGYGSLWTASGQPNIVRRWLLPAN
jgi:hypothetical protein